MTKLSKKEMYGSYLNPHFKQVSCLIFLTPVPDTRAYQQTTQLAASNTLHIVFLQLSYLRTLLIAKIT